METIFEKSHRSSVIFKIVELSPQLVQNLTPIRKLFCTFVYQCCYYPRYPLEHIRQEKSLKDQKRITSLHFTSLSLFSLTRSIAGTAQHSSKNTTCKTSAGVNKKFLHLYKRNPFKFFLKSPLIFKRKKKKKNGLQFYIENPL